MLTEEQRLVISQDENYQLTTKARSITDNFFGKNNDLVIEVVDDYDPNNPEMATNTKKFYYYIHRGIEVAGQTNPEKDNSHPSGHSWKDDSCKNIVNGKYRHVLANECKHGTIVVFVKDPDGKEIYRATLQPYHSESGNTRYNLDAEYGIIHPDYTKHVKELINRLTVFNKDETYTINSHVYNNSKKVTL
jgi:hypothetical protein